MTYKQLLDLNRIYQDVFIRNRFTADTKQAAIRLRAAGNHSLIVKFLSGGNLDLPQTVLSLVK